MGTRLLEFEEVRLVIHQSVIPVEWSLHLKIGVIYPLFVPKVIFFVVVRYILSNCLLILSLFVAICEIWLPGLTYGAYLVLFLKPGATIHYTTELITNCWYVLFEERLLIYFLWDHCLYGYFENKNCWYTLRKQTVDIHWEQIVDIFWSIVLW